MNKLSNHKGFTLLEVLVAVLVFSFGLLGIGGMMTISVKNNHNGYLRSQANFLAENMMDRMRANPVALWNGIYAGTAAPAGGLVCELGSECLYDDLAAYDMQAWADSIAISLPNGAGTINCVPNVTYTVVATITDAPSEWIATPPYDGMCTIVITWTESNETSAADLQTMTLVGQP